MKTKIINGKKYRFEPTGGELLNLVRKMFVDDATLELLEVGYTTEQAVKVVAKMKQQHDASEDARIAKVMAEHAIIRKKGVDASGSPVKWYTTNRG